VNYRQLSIFYDSISVRLRKITNFTCSTFLDKNNARSLEKNRQSVMRLRKRCEQFDNRFGRIDRLLRRYTGGHTQIYCLS